MLQTDFISTVGVIALVALGGAAFWFFLHTLAKVYDTANAHEVLAKRVIREDKCSFEHRAQQARIASELDRRISLLEKRARKR